MEQNGNLIKIDNYIEFQETLDLTRFLWTSNDTNSRRTEYQLVSVCFHLGDSSNSGHITCNFKIIIQNDVFAHF